MKTDYLNFEVPEDSVYYGVEVDIVITATFQGIAIQITAQGTHDFDVMAEANDLASIDEAAQWLARELKRTC